MAYLQPSIPFEQEVVFNSSDYEMDVILSIAQILNCNPFDPIIQNLNKVQIQWIFESYKRKNPAPEKEKGMEFVESMAEWQDTLSQEDFRKKLYKGNYPEFLKALERTNVRR